LRRVRVLITGAAGFAGRHLTEHVLGHGAEVAGLTRGSPSLPAGVQPIVCDLLDRDATAAAVRGARPDRVFHLAADASAAASWRDPAGVIARNLATTTSLLDAVAEHAPSAVVLVVSSGEVYGPPRELPVAEDHPLRPQNPYAVSKAATDLAAAFYADAGRVQTRRARAFNHAGPGQSGEYVIGGFAARLAAALAETPDGDPLVLRTGNTSAQRDFTDVRDVVAGYWAIAGTDDPEPFNVCSGRSVSVQEIIDGLAGRLGREIEQHEDPALMRPLDVPEIRGSHDRLTAATGWRPSIDIGQTLGDVIAEATAA
jgi:GDP-4-dehydro-6-deoxy-D-mannose reductase